MAVVLIREGQRYTALAADTKPTAGVNAGAELFETDTILIYVYDGAAWTLMPRR